MWPLVTCAASHRDHVEISIPKLPIHGLGHFSLVYPLSLLKKKKMKKERQYRIIISPWHLLKCHLNETKQCVMFLWVTDMDKSP